MFYYKIIYKFVVTFTIFVVIFVTKLVYFNSVQSVVLQHGMLFASPVSFAPSSDSVSDSDCDSYYGYGYGYGYGSVSGLTTGTE